MKILKKCLENKGYFTFAINTQKVNYLKIAYLQALSIKKTQKKINSFGIAVPTGTAIPKHYYSVIDYIVEIDEIDDLIQSPFRFEYLANILSPFEETIKLDSDIIFLSEIDYWFNLGSMYDICPTRFIKSFNYKKDTDNFYRQFFLENNIPNTYSAFTYFKKNDITNSFFKLVRDLMYYYYKNKKSNFYLPYLPTDEAYGLALKYMNLDNKYSPFTFVHMKYHIFKKYIHTIKYHDDWTKLLRYQFNDKLNLFVNNYKQILPFHYHIKSFCSNELIDNYEKYLGIK